MDYMEYLSPETFSKLFPGIANLILLAREADEIESKYYKIPENQLPGEFSPEWDSQDKLISEISLLGWETKKDLEKKIANRVHDILNYPKSEIDNFLSNSEFLDFIHQFRGEWKPGHIMMDLEDNKTLIPNKSPEEMRSLLMNELYGKSKDDLAYMSQKYNI